MKKISLLLVAALALVLSACGGSDKPMGNNYEEAYMNLMAKKKQLNAQGVLAEVATFGSRDLQTGINKVELETRAMLTRSLESKTSSLQKSFREEAGEEFLEHFTTATKTVSSRILTGTTLSEVPFFKEDNGKYRVVGLMIMDPKVFAEALAAEAEANEAMKVRFHASKAYKNLNDEVAAYENFKKTNTPVK